jgi:intracellular sulfur oxidation DsrE/DsrF family protein
MNSSNTSEKYRLNALADGELDSLETEALIQEIRDHPDLQRELCDIHMLKDMVKSAYPLEASPSIAQYRRTSYLGAIAASFLILAVGFIAGNWTGSRTIDEGFTLSMVEHAPNKVVLHIGDADNEKFERALAKAEQLLVDYGRKNMQVDIVTSAGGIDLLRHKTSLYIEKVSTMKNNYESLAFVACNNTLARLKQEGKPIDLVAEAVVAPSAVQYVVQRLQQGWSYVAI